MWNIEHSTLSLRLSLSVVRVTRNLTRENVILFMEAGGESARPPLPTSPGRRPSAPATCSRRTCSPPPAGSPASPMCSHLPAPYLPQLNPALDQDLQRRRDASKEGINLNEKRFAPNLNSDKFKSTKPHMEDVRLDKTPTTVPKSKCTSPRCSKRKSTAPGSCRTTSRTPTCSRRPSRGRRRPRWSSYTTHLPLCSIRAHSHMFCSSFVNFTFPIQKYKHSTLALCFTNSVVKSCCLITNLQHLIGSWVHPSC